MSFIYGNVQLGALEEINIFDMLVVPEELVELCSETMATTYGDGADNNFNAVLNQGKLLKGAGRTPIYLCSQDMKTLYVTSKEKINKEYH